MKMSMILFLLAMILTWVSAETSHPASTNQQEVNVHSVDQTGKKQPSSSQAALQSTQGNEGTVKRKEEGRREENEEEACKSRVIRVGSIPPSCKHKCHGCNPCHPIQIPTTSATLPLYANYEPEGWKCTCGSSFFNP